MKPTVDVSKAAEVIAPEGLHDPWAGDNGDWKLIVVFRGSEKPLEFGGDWSKKQVDELVNTWMFDPFQRPEWYDRVKYFDKRKVR